MTQREAALDLDWDDQGIPQYEEAPLTFDIPGYEYDHAHSDVAITSQFMSPTFGFTFTIEGLKSPRGDFAQLWNDVDFGIPNGDTVEEMMQAAENITPQGIADALAAKNYLPDDGEDTASRHASDQPTLGLDWTRGDPASTLGELGLDWTRCLDDYAEYEAWLPALPGYPEMGDEDSEVYVAPLGDEYTFWMEIAPMEAQLVKLTDMDFDLPHAKTADEMMQEVDSLTIQDILDALAAVGWEPDPAEVNAASRSASIEHGGKHMIRKATKRTAALDSTWERTGNGEWAKNLPAIPGYPGTQTEGNAQVVVQPTGDGFGFDIFILLSAGVDYIHLDNRDFGIPDTDTAEEMMQAVDNLSLRDIANMLDDMGYGPIDNPTAARKPRHATRRKADMSLDWKKDYDYGDWKAPLPDIPGYPCADGYSNHVQVADQSGLEGTDWAFYMYLELQKETVHLYNEDFGIPDTATAEEMMNIVDNLSVQDIADALAAQGYMPEEG